MKAQVYCDRLGPRFPAVHGFQLLDHPLRVGERGTAAHGQSCCLDLKGGPEPVEIRDIVTGQRGYEYAPVLFITQQTFVGEYPQRTAQ